MRAGLRGSGWILLLTLTITRELAGQGAGTLVLAKDATGPITATSLALSLHARVPCDETQTLVPDDSRLVADSFTMSVDEKGRGTFRGVGTVLSPSGRPLFQVLLHGLVGLGAPASSAADCAARGHLEGSLEALPTLGIDAATGREGFVAAPGLDARFSADSVPESASPLPLYRARIDGFVSTVGPPPHDGRVAIVPDRPFYDVNDPITAFVKNGSSGPIVSADGESYCTIVQLQREVDGRWVEVAGCPVARMPLPTRVAAGEALEVRLPPDRTTPATKEPGAYRLSLTYAGLDASGQAGERATIVSNAFRVASAPPPPPEAAGVKVVTDRPGYRAGESIVATIVNGGDLAITVADHRSFCSLVSLQRLEAGGWVESAPCPLYSPTKLMRIEPGQSVVVKLPTTLETAAIQSAGSYKIVLPFDLVGRDGQIIQPSVSVETPAFSIFAIRLSGE